jgi:hypothetical protein
VENERLGRFIDRGGLGGSPSQQSLSDGIRIQPDLITNPNQATEGVVF